MENFSNTPDNLLHKVVYAYDALSDEDTFGVLAGIDDDGTGSPLYNVRGRYYTHVRRAKLSEIEGMVDAQDERL